MKDILWILVIVLASVSQWFIIEKKVRIPNHLLWFVFRVGVFGLFLWWYIATDFIWYLAAYYMLMTFAWIFPLLLNIFRGKPLGYMSNRGFDRFVQKTIGAGIYWWLGLVLMVMAIGLQLAYGNPLN